MELQFSLTAKVAGHIRRMIELRILRPGDTVPLEQIEKDLSVSRTPAREAIRQLELEHLVAIEPGRGAYVSLITESDFTDLYTLRIHLEAQAVRIAAGSISDYDLHLLGLNLEEFEEQFGVSERLTLLDRQFHNTIIEACGNRYVEKALKSLRIRMGLLRRPAYQNSERTKYTLSEHKEILKHLSARDADLAENAMRTHIQNAWTERISQEGYEGTA
ncbi:MAG: GntR family transcriptional regulator [Pseudomonadota bacterium]